MERHWFQSWLKNINASEKRTKETEKGIITMSYREDEAVVESSVDAINVLNYKLWGFEPTYWWLRHDKKPK